MNINSFETKECNHEWGNPNWVPSLFDGDAKWVYTCQKCGCTLETYTLLAKNNVNIQKGKVKRKVGIHQKN